MAFAASQFSADPASTARSVPAAPAILKVTTPADSRLTVVLPEMVPAHWWEQVLHNQTALRLKAALLFRPGVVVARIIAHRGRASRRRPPESGDGPAR